jgi:hypothetical protein
VDIDFGEYQKVNIKDEFVKLLVRAERLDCGEVPWSQVPQTIVGHVSDAQGTREASVHQTRSTINATLCKTEHHVNLSF